jgi:hypothetical protein
VKWFVAALFRRGVHVRSGKEEDRVKQGPFKSDAKRSKAMRQFERDNRTDFVVITIPFDVQGDDDAVVEVGEIEKAS